MSYELIVNILKKDDFHFVKVILFFSFYIKYIIADSNSPIS